MSVISEKEFLKCVGEYEKLIFSVALSFTRNYFDAQDLTQETFVSAYKNLDRFDGVNIKGWLTTICANKCKDFLRRLRPISDIDDEVILDNKSSPEQVFEKSADEEYVKKLCDRLKEPYKTVAIKYFCEEEVLSNYANKTGQNLKTLQTQLYRAKKQLAIMWKEENLC